MSRKRISGDMRKVRENLEILDTVDLYITRFIEDKLGEGLVDNENEEYEISLEGDVRSKSGKGEVKERNKLRMRMRVLMRLSRKRISRRYEKSEGEFRDFGYS